MAEPNITASNIKNVDFGENVKIMSPVNLYGCRIGDNCFIGPFTEIQTDVEIGNNTRIQSHSFICSKVFIGNECFIGHGSMFINDTFSSGSLGGGIDKWRSTRVGNNVLIGSNSTILPVTICDGVVIGAGAVVTKDIHIPGKYVGNPAMLLNVSSGSDDENT